MALGDDLKYPRPGQPIYQAPRAFYNRLIDLSRAERDNRYSQGGGPSSGDYGVLAVTVWNNAGALVPPGGVLELSGLAEAAITGADWLPMPAAAFTGAAPTAAGKPFCVLLDTLKAGDVGLGAVAGCVTAIITGEGDFAAPEAGNTGRLLAGGSGAPIVWSAPGTGLRWAYVLLPPPVASVGLYVSTSAATGTFIERLRVEGINGLVLAADPAPVAGLTSTMLRMLAASATVAGVVTTADQTFAGHKTFTWVTGTVIELPGGGGSYLGIGTARLTSSLIGSGDVELRLSEAIGGNAVFHALRVNVDTGYYYQGVPGVSATLNGINFSGGIAMGGGTAGVTGEGGWATVQDGVVTGLSETIDAGTF